MKTIFLILALHCFALTYTQKINGVSFVSNDKPINDTHVLPIVSLNANYVALNPFAVLRGLNNPNLIFNVKRQWFGETEAGIIQYATSFKKHQIKIMLKPQIWVVDGEFTGFIKMTSEKDWVVFENTYAKFILTYAKIAQTIKADIFCLGVELEQFATLRPAFWRWLIKEVKKVYDGKLTYAANWDAYKKISFWDDLDYIGVDAYFPLNDAKTPALKDLIKAWQPYKKTLFSKSIQYKKPILFTEYGYRSVDYTAKEPWQSDHHHTSKVNLKGQQVALQALYQTFWNEKWFAGGFIWKWHASKTSSGGKQNNRFTPQNKPAELLIKKVYQKFS
jgi:hypothetical protein